MLCILPPSPYPEVCNSRFFSDKLMVAWKDTHTLICFVHAVNFSMQFKSNHLIRKSNWEPVSWIALFVGFFFQTQNCTFHRMDGVSYIFSWKRCAWPLLNNRTMVDRPKCSWFIHNITWPLLAWCNIMCFRLVLPCAHTDSMCARSCNTCESNKLWRGNQV